MAHAPGHRRKGAESPPEGQGAPMEPRGLMPAQQAPQGGGDAMPKEGMPEGMEEPTPEEQELYEATVANAMKAVYSGETAEMIVQVMEPVEGQYPVENLANILAPMLIGIEASGSASGAPVTREMTVQAGLEIIEDIGTELLPAAGLDPLTEGEIEGAFLRTMQLIGADAQAGEMAAMQQGAPGGGEPADPAGPRGLMPRPEGRQPQGAM